jgi:hypothetical protein
MLKNMSIILKRSGIAVFVLMAYAALPGISSAAIVGNGGAFNGILDGDDSYSSTKTVDWTNNHHSIYAPGYPGVNGDGETLYDGSLETELRYTATSDTLKLFIEVPTFAKNMIWSDDNANLDADHVAAYDAALGVHHVGDFPPGRTYTFDIMTKSEHFVLVGSGDAKNAAGSNIFSEDLCMELDGVHNNCSPHQTDDSRVAWKTSLDYLLDTTNGLAECGAGNVATVTCEAYSRSMSLEVMITGLEVGDANRIIASIDSLVLHLSDEARDLPQVVPVPAAFWLFGTAMFGLIGMRRKAKLAA